MSEVFSVNFDELKKCLRIVLKGPNSVLICGESGIGKSQNVFDYVAKNLGEWRNLKNKDLGIKKSPNDWYTYPVIDIRVAQMADVGDITGLPFEHEGKTTKFKPMHWMDRICQEPCILLADEVDRGDRAIGQSFFQIGDSRRHGDNQLHPHTVVISTINGGAMTANKYQVRQFDFAELSRWVIFYLQPSVEEWLIYGKGREIHELILSFISANRSHLRHIGKFEPDKLYPTPRSWERLSNILKTTDILDTFSKLRDVEKDIESFVRPLLQSYVGFEATTAFIAFCRDIYKDIPSIEDVLERFDEIEERLKVLNEMQQNVLMDRLFFWIMGLPDTHKFSDQHAQNIGCLFPNLCDEVYMHNFKKMNREYVWVGQQITHTDPWLKRKGLSNYKSAEDGKLIPYEKYTDAERFGRIIMAGQELDKSLNEENKNE